MRPYLKQTIDLLEQHFRTDTRCLGIYLWGSAGKGTEDAYSDVDIAIVVRDEDFSAIKSELPSICERFCGPIAVWLPEGASEQACNFAFLFEADSALLLYDFTVITRKFLLESRRLRLDRILFDREGLLTAARAGFRAQPYSPDRLLPTIDEYWVYAYLNGKYYKRLDTNKLLYVQQHLFQVHVRLLHALHPDAEWSWWPLSIKHLAEERQPQMRVYFGAREPEEIGTALDTEFSLFSEDAQAACRAWDKEYPRTLEQSVRQHLRSMGLPMAGQKVGGHGR
jgi:predicted nucleotidyltransferase